MSDQLPITGGGVEPPPDPDLAGPFPVGRYAAELQGFLRQRTKVLVTGELTGFKRSRVQSFFELRDARGALPCSIWNSDLEDLGLDAALLADGAEVVVGGGLDYYPGSATSSPSFSFRATHLRLAGEGDLLARLRALREELRRDGLFDPQSLLPRPALPKVIGVVTARGSAACQDLLAGLERRGWRGTIVWADTPVQDRRAAPRIAAALRGLAECGDVEVAAVCRGGGSLADLWAFCDEDLCRTVALLRLPVVSAVGHESDRTLIDDVSAVACSTPTHAAEELVRVDVKAARETLRRSGGRVGAVGGAAVARRARRLGELATGPARSVRAERSRLHQMLREVRAASVRGLAERERLAGRHGLVVARKGSALEGAAGDSTRKLDRLSAALAARGSAATRERTKRLGAIAVAVGGHDPQRTLERGYALVEAGDSEPVTTAAEARSRGEVSVRFADDAVDATIRKDAADE